MARRKKGGRSQAKLQGYVVVIIAEDWDQAKDYETLLKASDIPVVIDEQYNQSTRTNEIAVMVPEDFLDEAHVVIESQDAYDDFYDMALDDEDEAGFDEDYFDDDY